MKRLFYPLLALAALISVAAVAMFIAAIWTEGDPHNLSGKWSLTGVVTLFVAASIGCLADVTRSVPR